MCRVWLLWPEWKRSCHRSSAAKWILGPQRTSADIFATGLFHPPSRNMNAADRIRIQHILDAAAESAVFISGHVAEDLSRDRLLLLALVKEIEIVGEAATQISAELRATSPEIPWAKITGMRNR